MISNALNVLLDSLNIDEQRNFLEAMATLPDAIVMLQIIKYVPHGVDEFPDMFETTAVRLGRCLTTLGMAELIWDVYKRKFKITEFGKRILSIADRPLEEILTEKQARKLSKTLSEVGLDH